MSTRGTGIGGAGRPSGGPSSSTGACWDAPNGPPEGGAAWEVPVLWLRRRRLVGTELVGLLKQGPEGRVEKTHHRPPSRQNAGRRRAPGGRRAISSSAGVRGREGRPEGRRRGRAAARPRRMGPPRGLGRSQWPPRRGYRVGGAGPLIAKTPARWHRGVEEKGKGTALRAGGLK